MPSPRVINLVTEIHGDKDSTDSLVQRKNEMAERAREMLSELRDIEEALGLATIVSRVIDGMPVVIDDTTTMGGSWIAIHSLDYARSRDRRATINRNVRTLEWMLSISMPGLRSGGEIVLSSDDKEFLIEKACDWVTEGVRP